MDKCTENSTSCCTSYTKHCAVVKAAGWKYTSINGHVWLQNLCDGWDDAGKTTDSTEQNVLLESKIQARDESRSWEMQLLPLSSWLVVSCLCERQQLPVWAGLQVRGSRDPLQHQSYQHLSMFSAVCALDMFKMRLVYFKY